MSAPRTPAVAADEGTGNAPAATAAAAKPAGAKPGAAKPPNVVRATWKGGQRFEAGRLNGPALQIDGTGETGQSPVDALLSALASCVSIDVVGIIAKRKTPASRVEITVTAQRADATPRRIVEIRLDFAIDGVGIDRGQAMRAIDLSLNKYCSVRDSLARDILYSWSLTLNGEPGAPGE